MMTVSEKEVERHFGQFAKMANDGQRILVTHDGRPWVVLQPPPRAKDGGPALQWPDYPAHWKQHFPDGPTPSPTASELLAQDKEDRF